MTRRLSWFAHQLGHSRRVARDAGWKAAISERLGAAMVKSPQWGEIDDRFAHEHASRHVHQYDLNRRVEAIRGSLGDTDTRHAELAGQVRGNQAWVEQRFAHDVPAQVAAVRDEAMHHVHAQAAELHSLQRQIAELHSMQRQIDELRVGATALQHIVTDWLWAANAPLPSRPLITVVMTTAFPARIDFLRSAIESVLGQTYREWELIAVDDSAQGFLDPMPEWWPDDPRVRIIRGDGMSEGRARNVALDVATGEIIAYLDDDCRWFPWWLHAVARAFGTEPNIGIVHGIRVIEADPDGQVWTYAQTLEPLTLHVGNPADTNVMAHRSGLPNSTWPALSSCADYDTVVRLSGTGARYLPVPAATYAVSSPSRAWAPERAEANAANFAVVQRRARRARPLRVVAHNGLYPLLSETYIGDELEALRRRDVDIVLSRVTPATVPTPSRIDVPLYESLEEAIGAHEPDLVLCHWAGIGMEARPQCAAASIPYAIRLHSFDGRLRAHELIDPWCIGLWGFPHLPREHHLQFHLDTLVVDPGDFGEVPRQRRVLSLSAGLPKKDFATLIDAFALLRTVPFDIVMATTNGYETVPAEVRGLVKHHRLDGTVVENMPYEQAQATLRSAGALVYSIAPEEEIGQPRSVIEAAIAGTPLVLPAGAAFDALIGPTAHRYERGDPASLAAALDAALERPASVDERRALSARVLERHAGEQAFDAWANSLTSALVTWRRRSRTDREGANLRWWWQT